MSAGTLSVGFAEVPAVVRALLDEALTNVAAAATALEALAVAPDRHALRDEIARRETEGDRITHDLQHEVARRFTGAVDRIDVLRLAQSIDDILDAVDEAAAQIARDAAALDDDELRLLGSAGRDLVRSTTRAVAAAMTRRESQEVLQARAHELRDETAQRLRRARQHAVERAGDPLRALRAGELLRRLEAIARVCGSAASAANLISVKYA